MALLPNNNTTISESSYKSIIKTLHTKEVINVIINYRDNIVLESQPPLIDESEKILTRRTRTTLAQLRSGWSKTLTNYMSRINPEVANICPTCNSTPHDVRHLFSCPGNPTTLTTDSLWSSPIEAANFRNIIDVNDSNYRIFEWIKLLQQQQQLQRY